MVMLFTLTLAWYLTLSRVLKTPARLFTQKYREQKVSEPFLTNYRETLGSCILTMLN